MLIDQQYIRRYRQHIPFYKSNYPNPDRRVYWHHNRCLCDPDCIFGIPVVVGQYLMFEFEDPDPTGLTVNPFGASSNTRIELCCISDGDSSDCPDLVMTQAQLQLASHRNCIIDGSPIQFNYLRFQFPAGTNCGLHYLKIVAYEGTSNERIFYSQPIEVFTASDATVKKLVKLNINDSCSIGGIQWSEIFGGWSSIDGYEVYLPWETAAAFVQEVSDEEVEEDGKGNEIQVFEKTDWRYQFDTGFVPDHYAEIIKEITHTDNNSITIPDRQAKHKFCIGRESSTMTPDGDGCLLNVNMTFLTNTYSSDACCDDDPCECPKDNAITAISYTTDQDVAELAPDLQDTYLIPNIAPIGVNPDWNGKENQIAVWNGSGWDYSPNSIGLYVTVDDAGDCYLSLGVGNEWVPNDAYITNIVELPLCQITITGVIPLITWAKVQISVAGLGVWSDIDSIYYDSSQWQAGQTFSVPVANNYDFRLVHLNIGCGLQNSPIETFLTTNTCIQLSFIFNLHFDQRLLHITFEVLIIKKYCDAKFESIRIKTIIPFANLPYWVW